MPAHFMPASPGLFLRRGRCPFGGSGPGRVRGACRAVDGLSDLLATCVLPVPGEPAASSQVIISSLSLESWTLPPRVLLAAGRPGPHGHIILGRGCVRSDRPRRHRATSVQPERAARGGAPHPVAPGVVERRRLGGTLAGGDPGAVSRTRGTPRAGGEPGRR